MSEAWETLFEAATPEFRAEHNERVAHHEAGHAVGWWWLDRSRFLGRKFFFPVIEDVQISLDGRAISPSIAVEKMTGTVQLSGKLVTAPWETLASMMPPDDPWGRDPTQLGRFQRRRAQGDLIHIMCGPVAETLHDGWGFKDAQQWRDWEEDQEEDGWDDEDDQGRPGYKGSDYWQVEDRIPYLGRRWRLHLTRAFETADQIVREHQPHIKALAHELVTHGRVEGEDVYALFDELVEELEADQWG